MLGVVYVFEFDNNKVPPVAAEYQSIVVPVAPVAEISTVPVPQREPAVPVGATVVFTVVVMAFDVAGEPVTQR